MLLYLLEHSAILLANVSTHLWFQSQLLRWNLGRLEQSKITTGTFSFHYASQAKLIQKNKKKEN